VANGLPERYVAIATLASAPSLPPAAMQGHVMPSFLHTLIGLGPFANLCCCIVFTKMTVSVIHLDGHSHSILEGWRKQDGPRLWCFPLHATRSSLLMPKLFENCGEPGPRESAANFFQLPPTNPIQSPAGLLMLTLAQQLSAAPLAQPHPSQGIFALNNAGQACTVTYM
jgi:hypothetical protein